MSTFLRLYQHLQLFLLVPHLKVEIQRSDKLILNISLDLLDMLDSDLLLYKVKVQVKLFYMSKPQKYILALTSTTSQPDMAKEAQNDPG